MTIRKLLAGAALCATAPVLNAQLTGDMNINMDVVDSCSITAEDFYMGYYRKGSSGNQFAQASNVSVTCGSIQTYSVAISTDNELSHDGDDITYTIYYQGTNAAATGNVAQVAEVGLSAVDCTAGSQEWDAGNPLLGTGVGALGVAATQFYRLCYEVDRADAEAATSSADSDGVADLAIEGAFQDVVSLTMTVTGLGA